MPRHSIYGQPMTSAQRQARYRARKARERGQAAPEQLHGIRSNLGKLCRYVTVQGDPMTLAAVLAALDGPPLPIAMLVEAATWMTLFAEAYRHGVALQQAPAAPTSEPDPRAKHAQATGRADPPR
jgi:hypothetical protein